jgi:hypothetical protein
MCNDCHIGILISISLMVNDIAIPFKYLIANLNYFGPLSVFKISWSYLVIYL